MVSATYVPKTSNIPDERFHLGTRGEARAWQAGVFRNNLGAGVDEVTTNFFATRFGLGITRAG
jgi:hypothetical protein